MRDRPDGPPQLTYPAWHYGLAILAFAVGSLVFAWPWLFGGWTIPWDAKAHFYPQLTFLARSIHEGQWPFWTPNIFGGHPQIADPQSLIFSPPYLLLALLSPVPSFAAFDGVLFFMLFAGGVAIILLFKDESWHPAGATVAAFAFAFGASNAWRIQHVGQVLSMAWFAIALWLLLRALRRRSPLYGALAGLVAGLMIIDRDQVALLCALLLGLFAAWRLFEHDGQSLGRRLLGAVPVLLAGAITGVIVIAVPIAFTLALAEQSNRAVIDFASAVRGSLHPSAFFTLISANLFGTDGPLAAYWGPPVAEVWGANDLALARNMADIYLGALPIVAILTFGLVRGGLFARDVRMFTVAAVLMVLYALGGYTPVFELLFKIPGSDLFRRPADATFPIGAMLAIVGGYLVHRLATVERGLSQRQLLIGAGLVALAFLACFGIAFDKGRLAQATQPLTLTALCLVGAVVLAAFMRSLARNTFACILLVALFMTADLRLNNGPNESTALPSQNFDVLVPGTTNPTIEFLRQRLAQDQAPDRRDRVELAAIDFHWPNASLSQNIDHWLGYNPVRLKWFADATGAIDHVAIPDQRQFAPLFPSYRSPMADLLGLRYIATGVPAEQLDKNLKPGDLVPLTRTKDAYIYENPRALPRVLFATTARKADFAAMTANGQWPDVDYRSTVLLENPPEAVMANAPGSARIVSYRNTEVVVEAASPEGGWLVLNDVWHPWWQVEVDGVPAKLLRANVIFRAVALPPGQHQVRFVFRPFAGLWAQLRGRSL
ncbi:MULTISPECIES: hypothetical protein [unclassified Beijerinckia]|uniref:hypothetical protein n=1 Tax=unclassified Beijerinckia TaxID=2638183 RepID=UPI000B82E762|nr:MULTISPECIES: hypothetical protein [unclassified Beijerinckia]